jgi:chromosome segregation ATPase
MTQNSETFNCLVNLAGIEYPEEIDLGLVGCYVYHETELLDVLVLSDTEQKLKIKNISTKDVLRFECKLLGTKQQFLGRVSFTADKLLAIEPEQSWSQLFPLFGEDEEDECRKPFGDVKVVPPCILLTFQPSAMNTSTVTSTQKVTKTSTHTKKSESKTSGSKTSGSKTTTKKTTVTATSKVNKVATKPSKALTLEERVYEVEDNLAGDMGELQVDDRNMVDRLDVLDTHHSDLQQIHEVDLKKNEETQKYLNDLLQVVGEMKEQDQEDVKELVDMKGQLDSDVQAASADLEVLLKDTKDLNDYISDKSGETYDSENGTIPTKHKAIRRFLLSTLQNENQENVPVLTENGTLRNKVNALRTKVRSKFLNNEGVTDDEINELLREYEDLLDQHAEIFKQLDQEANDNVDDFDKHGDLWKKLFTEGMDLEKRCDDIDYALEGLTDKEAQLIKLKAALERIYADYIGKFKYVTEQQKGIIEELRTDTRSLETEITTLRRQLDQGTSELHTESQEYARGRNTKNNADLEKCMNAFVDVHQEKRRVQDDGENVYDEWVKSNEQFIEKGYAQFGTSQKDKGTLIRIQELKDKIFQSNEDIEQLLADLQRIQREKAINEHRNIL